MDPRDRFSATVEDYERARPDYPASLFDWILEDGALGPGATVIDVGCGTGIATRQLAARGLSVIGADPNDAMLAAARRAGGERVTFVSTDAETLDVGGARADAITGFQCFHWIDLDRALPRMRAVLRPGGRIYAVWNLRDARDPLMAAYEALLLERAPEYAEVGAEPRAHALAERVEGRNATFPHAQWLDRAAFFGRVWSSSYVRHGVTDRDAFDAALGALFDRFAEDGRARFVYRTTALSFR
ncbi:MAG: methyltransferase domain-containing protein [Sandaracinaceae bacterium]|nr:methyltransferase domain-containing protein [Sandaracinaceae bacterium]